MRIYKLAAKTHEKALMSYYSTYALVGIRIWVHLHMRKQQYTTSYLRRNGAMLRGVALRRSALLSSDSSTGRSGGVAGGRVLVWRTHDKALVWKDEILEAHDVRECREKKRLNERV